MLCNFPNVTKKENDNFLNLNPDLTSIMRTPSPLLRAVFPDLVSVIKGMRNEGLLQSMRWG